MALVERRMEWMGEPEGSFVPRNTIIIVTFDQGGTLVHFMDHCFFPSSHPSEDSLGRALDKHTQTSISTPKFLFAIRVYGCGRT